MSDNKLIVAGSRGFKNKKLFLGFIVPLMDKLDFPEIYIRDDNTEIDRMAMDYAQERGLTLIKFPAYWKKEGNMAGSHRYDHMTIAATHALIFWDGFSKDMTDLMNHIKKRKLKGKLVLFDHEEGYGHQYNRSPP